MRSGRPISRCGCYFTNAIRHASFRRQVSSVAARGRLSEAQQQQRENESWAKQSGAREALAQPPFDVNREEKGASVAGADVLESLDAYLQARKWHHPEGPARRFLSHLLTYPLTLAAGLHEAGLVTNPAVAGSTSSTAAKPGGAPRFIADNPKEGDWNTTSSSRRLAVVCVGARAESSMPPTFWRETLFALPSVSHLTLHLIGPELSLPSGLAAGNRPQPTPGTTLRDSPPATTTAAVSVGARTAEIRWTRAMLRRTAGGRGGTADGSSGVGEGLAAANHSETAADEAVAEADAFVLFNPGLGHPHLREGWDGALKRLLATGKPIVVSCHSQKDLDRDARLLCEAGAVSCRLAEEGGEGGGESDSVSPRENPFRSLVVSEDPLSPAGAEEVVSCNWGVMIVKGVEGGEKAGSGLESSSRTSSDGMSNSGSL